MSPAKNQIAPTSRRSRLRLFFATNPGEHDPKDVAAALGDEVQRVQNECARMARSGDLIRTQVSPPALGQPKGISTYSAAPTQETTAP